ncbi:MAG: energy transducer TonB [Chthoniobacterales bacterium]|nr:energy transducer TonB [Chthoniobacterales bacterium]
MRNRADTWLTTNAPLPSYPLEARRKRWAGAGFFVLRFAADGRAVKAVVLRSTGHAVIDDECLRQLSKWRCRPGVYSTIKVPANFDFSS